MSSSYNLDSNYIKNIHPFSEKSLDELEFDEISVISSFQIDIVEFHDRH